MQKYIVYTSEQLSYNDEKPLENTKCMHADVLHMMCIGKEERLVQFEILASSGLDVHASTGNQTKGYFNPYGKPCLGGGVKEAGLLRFLATTVYYERQLDMRSLFWFKEQKVQIKFLFLLRPRKEYQASTRAWDIWSLLCLKEIGWVHQHQN